MQDNRFLGTLFLAKDPIGKKNGEYGKGNQELTF
jgi:hypothetical protein